MKNLKSDYDVMNKLFKKGIFIFRINAMVATSYFDQIYAIQKYSSKLTAMAITMLLTWSAQKPTQQLTSEFLSIISTYYASIFGTY